MMKLDAERDPVGLEGALFDDVVLESVDGIVAQYYTGHLRLIPNPFCCRDIADLLTVFPRTIDPFDVEEGFGSRRASMSHGGCRAAPVLSAADIANWRS